MNVKMDVIIDVYNTLLPLQISSIGLPTNVSHTGHASSEEEAKKLIEQLMSGGGSDLPAPMLPSPGEWIAGEDLGEEMGVENLSSPGHVAMSDQ